MQLIYAINIDPEQYVAESYDARAFVELLQNADDAGASCFTVLRAGRFLFAANNGHCFTESDFESLCRSAASARPRPMLPRPLGAEESPPERCAAVPVQGVP